MNKDKEVIGDAVIKEPPANNAQEGGLSAEFKAFWDENGLDLNIDEHGLLKVLNTTLLWGIYQKLSIIANKK